jgi:integrase
MMSITRSSIASLLMEIAAGRGPVSADRCRATLSALFTWVMKEGICEANPTIATNTHSEGKPRERVLSADELAEIWKALPMNDYGRIVKLLMITGQRREEIAARRWSEIDFDKGLITLPPARTKNKREHCIPLSDFAMEVLAGCSRRDGRDFVFGGGKGGFQGWRKSKKTLDATIIEARVKRRGEKLAPFSAWRLHDLRRTCATMMAQTLGVLPHVIEATLNHISGHKAGVAGIYNRANYEREVRAALLLWADYVRSIVGDADRTVPPMSTLAIAS